MSIITPTQSNPPIPGHQNVPDVLQTVWANVSDVDTCTSVRTAYFANNTVQMTGNFAGATVILEGSNDNVTFFTLLDLFAAPVTFTSSGIKSVAQIPLYVRPSTSGGLHSRVAVNLVSRR